MVEMALALGVLAFALLSVLALLPLGVRSNQVSTEETRAAGILTLLEADIRNSHPADNSGNSRLFGLPLPYVVTAGVVTLNTSFSQGTWNTVGLDDDETPKSISATSRPRYQASVVYTQVPAPGALASTQARLIVNWPAVDTINSRDLTDLSRVRGYVEASVAFPAP
jgi:hypothetical protein